MRLLRQISLEGHTTLGLSSNLKSFGGSYHDVSNSAKFNNNFGKHLTEVLDRNIRLLTLINEQHSMKPVDDHRQQQLPLLKALEELNSNIVSLIKMCTQNQTTNNSIHQTQDCSNFEKQKSKLRRHYSAFVDGGGQLFNRSRKSLHILNGSPNEKDPSCLLLSNLDSSFIQTESIIENSIHKIIESNILNLLVDSMANIGFEEKKMARIILTNSLTINVKKNKVIVDYFCDSSNPILQHLVESYEHGKSDITLNCGSILRFACQFESILVKLVQSNYFYKFFSYMKRSSSDYPFDVAMDVFYTFKTIMTKHKQSSANLLQQNSEHFFRSLIGLLEHAESTENYVTKRQTLEMFTETFTGVERIELRRLFMADNNFICSVIPYLWNRNLQIRLRCLSLLSQFVPINHEKINKQQSSTDKPENQDRPKGCQMTKLLIDKIKITYLEQKMNDQLMIPTFGDQKNENLNIQIKNLFTELKEECLQSNLKQFYILVIFIDHLIDELDLKSVVDTK